MQTAVKTQSKTLGVFDTKVLAHAERVLCLQNVLRLQLDHTL
jgi:hypothetical protein